MSQMIRVQDFGSKTETEQNENHRPQIFHTIGIDFVGELPCSPSRNPWIVTIVCPYSNYLKAVPVKDKKGKTAAKVLFEKVFLQFDFPSVFNF